MVVTHLGIILDMINVCLSTVKAGWHRDRLQDADMISVCLSTVKAGWHRDSLQDEGNPAPCHALHLALHVHRSMLLQLVLTLIEGPIVTSTLHLTFTESQVPSLTLCTASYSPNPMLGLT